MHDRVGLGVVLCTRMTRQYNMVYEGYTHLMCKSKESVSQSFAYFIQDEFHTQGASASIPATQKGNDHEYLGRLLISPKLLRLIPVPP